MAKSETAFNLKVVKHFLAGEGGGIPPDGGCCSGWGFAVLQHLLCFFLDVVIVK